MKRLPLHNQKERFFKDKLFPSGLQHQIVKTRAVNTDLYQAFCSESQDRTPLEVGTSG